MDDEAQVRVARSHAHASSAEHLAVTAPVVEWALVAFFYAAVHLIDAYLVGKVDYQPTDHRKRELAMRDQRELSEGRGAQIWNAYKALRRLSEEVRYNPGFCLEQRHVERARDDWKRLSECLAPKLPS